jgi:hypothetical protein
MLGQQTAAALRGGAVRLTEQYCHRYGVNMRYLLRLLQVGGTLTAL